MKKKISGAFLKALGTEKIAPETISRWIGRFQY